MSEEDVPATQGHPLAAQPPEGYAGLAPALGPIVAALAGEFNRCLAKLARQDNEQVNAALAALRADLDRLAARLDALSEDEATYNCSDPDPRGLAMMYPTAFHAVFDTAPAGRPAAVARSKAAARDRRLRAARAAAGI